MKRLKWRLERRFSGRVKIYSAGNANYSVKVIDYCDGGSFIELVLYRYTATGKGVGWVISELIKHAKSAIDEDKQAQEFLALVKNSEGANE